MILPGSMLGVLGGGQLGLMFALAARRMGYRTTVVDPDPYAPAFSVADRKIVGSYTDPNILSELSKSCQAITTEFENVPSKSLAILENSVTVRPSSRSVATCQDRILEKTFLRENGFETTPFQVIKEKILPPYDPFYALLPGILKSSREGYDGKGQWPVDSLEDVLQIISDQTGPFVLEKRMSLMAEYSIVLARSHDGHMALYPVAENIHESGILNISVIPAEIPIALSDRIREIAGKIAEKLEYTGILSVEFFLGENGRLYVNELAPRPHNSGHYTIDACSSSQFDQHVRILAGISPSNPELLTPCAMGNLLGHLWKGNAPPDLREILEHPSAKLYLYGKVSARPGRKMGHFTVLGKSVPDVTRVARSLLASLSGTSLHE